MGPIKQLLGLLAAVPLALAAAPVTAAHAVVFNGPTDFAAGNFPQAIVVGNFNGDTDPDLAVANQLSDNISILLGGAGESFSAPTNLGLFSSANPLSVAVGDFNADADPDLAVANEGSSDGTTPGNVSILLGAAGSTFSGPTNFPAGTKPQSVAVGQFNEDADPDLAVVNESDNNVSILLGGIGGSFGAPTNFGVGGAPRAVVVGQFSGDSDADLAVANEGDNNVSILVGAAGGTFTGPANFVVCSAPTALAVGEFNGDADPDLVVVNELCDNVSVLLGSSGASFTPASPRDYAVGNLPDAVAVGHFNGDTDPDLAVANQGGSGDGIPDTVSLLFGGSGGSFTGPTNLQFGVHTQPSWVAVGQFNGDSESDLVVAREVHDNVSVFTGATFAGYARPKSASPSTFRLVPAFNECTSPSGTHGPPLDSASCDATQASSFLTLNAPDRVAPYDTGATSTASVKMKVFCTDGAAPPCTTQTGDQQDVTLDSTITGVRCVGTSGGCSAAAATYNGKILFTTTLRVTDRFSGPSLGEPATVTDTPFRFGIQCSAGACNSSTTADAVIPGIVQEQKRGVWQLSQIQVMDGGPDGGLAVAPAPGSGICPPACTVNDGETVFLRQGLFAP